jgi:alpha-L-rhamnosidase
MLNYTNRFLISIFSFLLFPLLSQPAVAQHHEKINPQLFESPWDANWVMHPTASTTDYGVFHFRKTFDIETIPDAFIIHVSGDTRYRLFINGKSVAKGPAVGDNHNWRFETVDIAEYLVEGKNIAAANVWNFAEYNALQHHSYRSAFLLQGNSETEAVLNTGTGWKVMKNEGYSPIPVSYQTVDGYYAAPHGEHFRAVKNPWGWKEPAFDDSGWLDVRSYEPGTPRGTNPYGNLYGWALIPRNIPMMEERKERISSLRRTEGIEENDGFLQGTETLEIPANSRAVLLLDQTYIINAYPVLHVSGGLDAEIKLIYAEALREEDNTKGHRDEVEGKEILGFHDTFVLDGGENRKLQTLWLRSYRYIQLEIETADEPLTLHDMFGIFTGYPFEENARFNSSDESLAEIWEVGWRTARLNAYESYWDCAYYEQLQYVGDTRIQALISLYVSGDDRLMRNSILHFNDSRMPDGITMSRYPSRHPQYIPPYSLLWITMVHDYWMHRKDDEFVRQFLPGIRTVIDWYEDFLVDELGILGPMPWWNYVDAASGFERGTPPGSDHGNSIVISLQMLYVLEYAVELADAYGQHADAARYRELIEVLRESIPKHGWSIERMMMADTPNHDRFSQHANILSILTGLIPDNEQEDLMQRIMEDDELVQATYYFRFYLFRAMREAGLGNEYLNQLDPWYDALALGMTTFPEHPEPSRSDAHAWSSSPNYDFLASVAGIRPDSPGFETVLIEPKPGHLDFIEATMPHPLGMIEVELRIDGDEIEATITFPEGLSGRFVWMGKEVELKSGLQNFTIN